MGKAYLRYGLLILLFIATLPLAYAQSNATKYRIIRSNTGVGGSSKTFTTSKGVYKVSQSIGQSSVIGTSRGNGYYLRQGFQQPHKAIKIIKSGTNTLDAMVYPNPFEGGVTITFNDTISNSIEVEIHDVRGRLVYKSNFTPDTSIQLQLKHLSMGAYMLRAISNGSVFNSKLIKN